MCLLLLLFQHATARGFFRHARARASSCRRRVSRGHNRLLSRLMPRSRIVAPSRSWVGQPPCRLQAARWSLPVGAAMAADALVGRARARRAAFQGPVLCTGLAKRVPVMETWRQLAEALGAMLQCLSLSPACRCVIIIPF